MITLKLLDEMHIKFILLMLHTNMAVIFKQAFKSTLLGTAICSFYAIHYDDPMSVDVNVIESSVYYCLFMIGTYIFISGNYVSSPKSIDNSIVCETSEIL